MKWVLMILAALAVAAIVGTIYVRMAGHDPARWHVDPDLVTEVQTRNQFLATNSYRASSDDLAVAVHAALGGEVLAGSLDDGWATYVIRTPLMGYPDYISVKIAETEEGSRVTLFSRSRYGHSDLGANKARVERVFAETKAALAGAS